MEHAVECVVISVGTVSWVVAIPWREVNPHLDALFLAGDRKLFEDISLKRRLHNGVGGELARPQAEAVVMLCCNDHSLHPRLFEGLDPLIAVQLGWVKRFGLFLAVAPFLAGERVGAKMDERIRFHLVPLQMTRVGRRTLTERSRSQ